MIKLILANFGKYKKAAIAAPIFVLIESVVWLIIPRLMSNIVDIGIRGGDNGYILRCGLLMAALSIVGAVCGVICARFSAKAANGLGSNLRVKIYEHMQNFSFADIDKFSTASLITRTTSDVRTLQMAVQMGIRILMQSPCMLIVSLVIVVGYSYKLALIYLFAIPTLFLCIGTLIRFAHYLFVAMQEKLDAMNSTIQENLIAIRVVKSFVRANHERRKFKKANDDLTAATTKAISLIIIMHPIASIIINAVTLLIYWFGGKLVGNGELLEGELLAIISYLHQIMMSIMMFSMVLMQTTRARASATRIAEVLETVPDISSPENAIQRSGGNGCIEFKNVSFKYSVTGSGEDVLKNISFKAEQGETIAIIGGTGSGKSSLVNLIPRFYDVTEGSVLFDGVDVRDYDIANLRESIGMVLQKNVLFSGTIRENMLWGKPDATEEEIFQALKNAQAYDFVMDFPLGLDTSLQQGGTNVSGGQKQRLCIARAMLRSPSVLILDDSTSAVDSDTESKIRESFVSALKDCTVFIIAQRISSVSEADKIIVLDEGGMESIGTHAQLLDSSRIYQDIYTSQLEGVFGNA